MQARRGHFERERTMRRYARLLLFIVTVAGLPSSALAQQSAANDTAGATPTAVVGTALLAEQSERGARATPADHREVWGYLFVAPGLFPYENGVEKAERLGVGIDWRPRASFGVGLEGSAAGVGEEAAFVMLSGNGSYYFRRPATAPKSAAPFVTAGVSRLTDGEEPHYLVNFGGGVNYWLRSGGGVRL